MCQIKFCCCCVRPFDAVRLIPLADLFEVFFAATYISTGYLMQDTWLAHTTVFVIGNIVSSFTKLIACLPMLTVRDPNPKVQRVAIWPFKCYYCFRILALLFSLLCIAAQAGVSVYGIKTSKFYNDFSYGFCS